MRRNDREIVGREEIEEVISRCQVCHLALSSPEGRPYVVALNFGYAPGNAPALYFHCALQGRKLDLLRQNPRCAFVLDRALGLVAGATACGCSMKYESVMGSGSIGVVAEAAERRLGLDLILAHYGHHRPAYDSAVVEKTLVLKLTIEELSGKRNG